VPPNVLSSPRVHPLRRRKLDVMKTISVRRVQRAWRRKLGWKREQRAEALAFMLAMRWKRKLTLKREHLKLGAAHVKEFIEGLKGQMDVVTKFKLFYKNVRVVQGHFKRGILMRQGQALMIAHQWHQAEEQAMKERSSKGDTEEPALHKKEDKPKPKKGAWKRWAKASVACSFLHLANLH
jgi:hypothetical protein